MGFGCEDHRTDDLVVSVADPSGQTKPLSLPLCPLAPHLGGDR